MLACHVAPTGDLACNPGMCPEWELNQRLFSSQASAQSTEPHQPGLIYLLLERGEGKEKEREKNINVGGWRQGREEGLAGVG